MELRHLRYYVALANELHFRRAAEELHITQPALSLQIRLLEEELGVQLLRRTKREVRLTSAGAVFLQHARGLLSDAESAVLAAQRAQRGETGELAVSFAPDLAYELLPFVIKTYLRRWPGVRLVLREFWSVEQVGALHSRQVHLAILHPPIDQRGLTIRTILRERFVAALPARHPLTKRHNVLLADLASEPWLRLPRPTSPGVADPMREIFRAGGFEPNVVEESAQISTLLGMVAAGIGVCVLPPAVRRMRFRGVAYRRLTRGGPELETAVAWLADAELPTVRPFVDILDEVIASRQAEAS
jgi:DNA-binding transcriptional LysR family regulator